MKCPQVVHKWEIEWNGIMCGDAEAFLAITLTLNGETHEPNKKNRNGAFGGRYGFGRFSLFLLFFFHSFNSVVESDVCAATVIHVNINNNNLPLVAQFIRRFLLLVLFFLFTFNSIQIRLWFCFGLSLLCLAAIGVHIVLLLVLF